MRQHDRPIEGHGQGSVSASDHHSTQNNLGACEERSGERIIRLGRVRKTKGPGTHDDVRWGYQGSALRFRMPTRFRMLYKPSQYNLRKEGGQTTVNLLSEKILNHKASAPFSNFVRSMTHITTMQSASHHISDRGESTKCTNLQYSGHHPPNESCVLVCWRI